MSLCRLYALVLIPLVAYLLYQYVQIDGKDEIEKRTAMGANMIRYQFVYYPIDYGIKDPVDGIFLPWHIKYAMDSPILRWIMIRLVTLTPTGPLLLSVLLRTQYFDDLWVDSITKFEIKQIVVFGSGNDARSIRFQQLLNENNVNVFELDLPKLLHRKKTILLKEFRWNELPNYLEFISCDLNELDLCDFGDKYDVFAKTLFQFEGVLMYLSQTTIDNIFKYIHEKSSKGSFVAADILSGIDESMMEYLKSRQEPLKFILEDANFRGFFGKYGFDIFNMELYADFAKRNIPQSVIDIFGLPTNYSLVTAVNNYYN